MKPGSIISALCLLLVMQISGLASIERGEFDEQLSNTISRLNREAIDSERLSRLTEMIRREYGTSEQELEWAVGKSLNWGEIVVFAYIQATTGRSFDEISRHNARLDFWTYAEQAGMNCDKMAHSLNSFLKRAEFERNTRIFERLRYSRRVHTLPDLGSGFGLVQEALDFRRIESQGPVKIHNDAGARAKGVDEAAGR
jgi:hypothetical protein